MNAIAATAPKKSVAKRVVSYVLLVMLSLTVLVSSIHSFADTNGLLTFAWLMSMFALACYWLRVELDERREHEETFENYTKPQFYGNGFHIAALCLALR